MPQVISFDDYSPREDNTGTISQLDRIACLFVVILHRKYLQRYDIISQYLTYHNKLKMWINSTSVFPKYTCRHSWYNEYSKIGTVKVVF